MSNLAMETRLDDVEKDWKEMKLQLAECNTNLKVVLQQMKEMNLQIRSLIAAQSLQSSGSSVLVGAMDKVVQEGDLEVLKQFPEQKPDCQKLELSASEGGDNTSLLVVSNEKVVKDDNVGDDSLVFMQEEGEKGEMFERSVVDEEVIANNLKITIMVECLDKKFNVSGAIVDFKKRKRTRKDDKLKERYRVFMGLVLINGEHLILRRQWVLYDPGIGSGRGRVDTKLTNIVSSKKFEAQRVASVVEIDHIVLDISPRGLNIEGEEDNWDLGVCVGEQWTLLKVEFKENSYLDHYETPLVIDEEAQLVTLLELYGASEKVNKDRVGIDKQIRVYSTFSVTNGTFPIVFAITNKRPKIKHHKHVSIFSIPIPSPLKYALFEELIMFWCHIESGTEELTNLIQQMQLNKVKVEELYSLGIDALDCISKLKEVTKCFPPEFKSGVINHSNSNQITHIGFARSKPFVPEEMKAIDKGDVVYNFINCLAYNGILYELDGLKEVSTSFEQYTSGENKLKVLFLLLPLIQEQIEKYSKHDIRFTLMKIFTKRRELNVAELIEPLGLVTRPAWVGMAYKPKCDVLASHLLGTKWYSLPVKRNSSCWNLVGGKENDSFKCMNQFRCVPFQLLEAIFENLVSYLSIGRARIVCNSDLFSLHLEDKVVLYERSIDRNRDVGSMDRPKFKMWISGGGLSTTSIEAHHEKFEQLYTEEYLLKVVTFVVLAIGISSLSYI